MAQSYVYAQESRPVVIGHICSGCGNPIVSVIEIRANAIQYYTYQENKARAIAQRKCKEAIMTEINKIRTHKSSAQRFFETENTDSKSQSGNQSEACILNISTTCPNCSSLEKWQKDKGQTYGSNNFPLVFDDMKSAEKWAEEIIENMMKEIDVKREDQNVIEDTAKSMDKLFKKNKELEKEISEIPEYEQRITLKREIESIVQRRNNLAILKFKERGILKKQIKTLNEKLEEIERLFSKKAAEPLRIININNLALQRLAPIVHGHTGKIKNIKNDNALVYMVTLSE